MLCSTAPDRPTQESEHLSPSCGHYCDIRERAEAILRTEVDFIMNASFVRCDHEAEDSIVTSSTPFDGSQEAAAYPGGLPAHLARLCEARVLTAKEERALFRAMNYAKYRVNVLRSQLAPEFPDLKLVEKAETFLSVADTIRDRILAANMRLVLSVVKKHVTPQYSFDELLSDGIDTLMKAVDKFDFDRGFRFSTYAYRSITRRAYRQISSRQEAARRFTHTVEEAATCQPDDSNGRLASPAAWAQLREMLDNMLSCLDRRERFIIRRRYGMGRSQKAATFQSMANKLGISKERVRQLESRAVGKLQTMVEEQGMSDLFEQNEATSLN